MVRHVVRIFLYARTESASKTTIYTSHIYNAQRPIVQTPTSNCGEPSPKQYAQMEMRIFQPSSTSFTAIDHCGIGNQNTIYILALAPGVDGAITHWLSGGGGTGIIPCSTHYALTKDQDSRGAIQFIEFPYVDTTNTNAFPRGAPQSRLSFPRTYITS